MMVNKRGDLKGKQCVKTMLNAVSCELEMTYMEVMPFNSAIVLTDLFGGCFLQAGFVFILHVFGKVNALLILVISITVRISPNSLSRRDLTIRKCLICAKVSGHNWMEVTYCGADVQRE